ncbi:GIY-YIG nuclease family protein [Patescibacteria group bacterium]|nr:GIY-YIG nuclease family protein [Patescibacteria group bacterium]MBU1256073.1 GIY-YIG nuclease family protein [Patescibacteria group bacterium]MBU1457603.1 GIY-YIG nuclease family protein [Patescibacteria group bacterium]
MKQWSVYIITNHKNTVLYTGITNNLKRRIWEHKEKIIGNSFSKKYRLYKLIWFEMFNNPQQAIEIEKKIKGWTRVKKINMIKAKNPTFQDLNSR